MLAAKLKLYEFNYIYLGPFNLVRSNTDISEFILNSNDVNANDLSSEVEAISSSQQSLPPHSILPLNPMSSFQVLGATPLTQVSCNTLGVDQFTGKLEFSLITNFIILINTGQLSPCASSDEIDSEPDSNNDDLSSNFSNTSSKRQKRGILPKQATSVMRAWLFQHLVVSKIKSVFCILW